MNLHACAHLPRRAELGVWHRAVPIAHQATPHATVHSRQSPGRFNPGTPADPAFEILYLAPSALIAQLEVQALLGSPYRGATFFPNPNAQWTVVSATVNLQSVVDLGRRAERRLLLTTVQELTGDWQGYALRKPNRIRGGAHGSDIPTQQLGAALEKVPGIEGFMSYSARFATDCNLMIFPTKLRKGSWLEFVVPTLKKPLRIAGKL